jgi:hypothetical protein
LYRVGADVMSTIYKTLTLSYILSPLLQQQFINSSAEVIRIVNNRLQSTVNNLQMISLTITTLIQDGHNTEYPSSFTHFPGVEHHFGLFRESSEASFIGYTPIIPEEDVFLWITYSQVEAEEWLLENPQEIYREDQDKNQHHEDDHRRKLQEDVAYVRPYIWKNLVYNDEGKEIVVDDLTCQTRSEIDHEDFVPVVETESPSNPLWHYSPPPKATGINAVNFNVRSEADFRDAFELVEATKFPTFRDICPSAEWFQVCTL